MSADDAVRLFEEAFAKIEPKTDAEREKLQGLREKILESRKEMEGEIEKSRLQLRYLAAGRNSVLREQIAENTKANERLEQETIDLFAEQIELIDQIARRTS